MESTTSLASGWAERMKLSEQQVHSNPCNQSTGMRGRVFMAFAICGTKDGPRPRPATVREQNLRNERTGNALPAHHIIKGFCTWQCVLLDIGCANTLDVYAALEDQRRNLRQVDLTHDINGFSHIKGLNWQLFVQFKTSGARLVFTQNRAVWLRSIQLLDQTLTHWP